MSEPYIPTLLEYAKVIDWLWSERHNQIHPVGVHMSDFPDDLAMIFGDALNRVGLSRLADKMAENLEVSDEPVPSGPESCRGRKKSEWADQTSPGREDDPPS